MDLAIKLLAAVLYLLSCAATLLKLTKKMNYANEDWYLSVLFVLLFMVLLKLNFGGNTLLLVLVGGALLARLTFVALRILRNRSTYELYNVNSNIEGEIYGLVDVFNRTLTTEKATAIFTNKRPYRIEFRGVPRKETQQLLQTVNAYIQKHGKPSLWIILELILLLVLGILLVLWFKNMCLISLLR